MRQFTPEENASRRKALYAFLLERGDKWTSMEQTTDTIRLYPAYFRTVYHNSQARRMLTRDIEEINNSEDFDKIIISGNRGIKLASEEEFIRFTTAETQEIFKKLKRLRVIIRKGNRDQQSYLWGQVKETFIGGL